MDAAERLFRAKGYADTSIQDVLDAVGASRGAFYHYFESKGELLEAVVDRMVTIATELAAPIVDDPTLDAPHKLRGLFQSITNWKLDRSELMHAMLDAWISDENALMREHYRRKVSATLVPLFTKIVDQGMREGTFHPGTAPAVSAEGTARAMVHVLLGLQTEVTHLFVAARRGTVTFDEVWQVLSTYPGIFEHVAGAPPGTFPFVEREVLREWFD